MVKHAVFVLIFGRDGVMTLLMYSATEVTKPSCAVARFHKSKQASEARQTR